MDCLRFTELASSAGVTQEEAGAYEEHRSRCAECAGAEAALNAVRDAVPPPSADALAGFSSRVRTRAAREQLARVFSPTRSALSAAAMAISAAAIVLVAIPHFTPPPAPTQGRMEGVASRSEDDVDLLATSDDPFASLTDDELRAVDQMMNESSEFDDETET